MGPAAMAKATGVSTDSLRHYERLGLLPGVPRSANGYRHYSPAAVRRVLLIQRALVVGFSLVDLQRILATRDRGGTPCAAVRALVGARLAALDARISELLELRDDLRRVLSGIGGWRGRRPGSQPTCSNRSAGGRRSSAPGSGESVDPESRRGAASFDTSCSAGLA